jgi:hypothetical protein
MAVENVDSPLRLAGRGADGGEKSGRHREHPRIGDSIVREGLTPRSAQTLSTPLGPNGPGPRCPQREGRP